MWDDFTLPSHSQDLYHASEKNRKYFHDIKVMKFRKENDYTNNNVLGYHCSVNGCLVSELKCVKQKTSTLSVHKDQGSTEAQFQFSTSLYIQFKKML